MRRIPTLSQRRLTNWNSRQRKKHYAGEFQELGFDLQVNFTPAFADALLECWMDDFIAEIERLKLGFGGGGHIADFGGYVSTFGRGSVSTAQRDSLVGWLLQRPEIATVRAGELVDAWHGVDTV